MNLAKLCFWVSIAGLLGQSLSARGSLAQSSQEAGEVERSEATGSSPVDVEQQSRISKLIEELGSARFAIRENATRELWSIGRAAENQLRKAAQSKNAEVAERAQAILSDFDYGIYPTTNRATKTIILAFRDGNINQKKNAGNSLLAEGKIRTLIKLILKEKDRLKIAPLVQELFGNSRFAKKMVEEGNDKAALEAFRLLLANAAEFSFGRQRVEDITSEYLWLAAVTGKLKSEATNLVAESETNPIPDIGYLQTRVFRALNDYPASRKVAKQVDPVEKSEQLVENLLIEEHQWDRLSDRLWVEERPPISELDVPRLLTGLICHRLAGKADRFDSDLKVLFQFSDPFLEDLALEETSGLFEKVNNATLFMITEFLLANGQLDKALEYLTRTDKFRAFDALVAIDDYPRAFQAIGYQEVTPETAKSFERYIRRYRPIRWSDSTDDIEKLARVVQTFYQLGLYAEARSLYRALFAVATRYEANQTGALTIVGKSLLSDDLKELFFELIEAQLRQKNHEFALECLFEDQIAMVDGVSLASFWWTVLESELPDQTPIERLRWLDQNLRPVLPTEKPKPDILNLARKIEEEFDKGLASWGDQAFLGYTYLLWNDKSKAIEWFEKYDFRSSPSSDVAMQLGHLYFDERQFDRASEAFLNAWRFGSQDVSGLYFSGVAQRQAGNPTKADESFSLAKKLMFSADEYRQVVSNLMDKELNDDAISLLEIATRVGPFQSWDVGTARFRLVNLLKEKDGHRAADLLENQLLDVVVTPRYYPAVSSYTYYILQIQLRKSGQYILESQPQQAALALKKALEVRPCNATIAEEYLPKLRALPEGQVLADELFESIRDQYIQRLKMFPNSGLLNNNLAWVNSTNQKHLQEALRHAELAVKNEPNNPTYIDTLADVCFNLGDTERAIQLMERCLRHDPLSEHYNQQIKRFREKLSSPKK